MSEELERERIRGLPGPLPAGERILWRGSPSWQVLAWRVFHIREALGWFALVGVLRSLAELANGGAPGRVFLDDAAIAGICLLACSLLAGLAWLSARTTIYTLTDRRVVMRIGIALPMTVNLPYRGIGGASARLDAQGAGDVGLSVSDGTRLAWLVLWPHCRPWRLRSPEPTMRAVADGARLANILSEALAAAARAEGSACVRTEIDTRAPAAVPELTAPDGYGAAT